MVVVEKEVRWLVGVVWNGRVVGMTAVAEAALQ
jgi:hypothetical protein